MVSLSTRIVCQILRGDILPKPNVDIQQWTFDQIKNAHVPLDPVLPKALELYVESVGKRGPVTGISEADIALLFENRKTISARHVLALYYVLLYNDMVEERRSGLQKQGGDPIYELEEYTDNLLDRIPTKQILSHVEDPSNQPTYHTLYPRFWALMCAQYPEVLDVGGFLCEEGCRDKSAVVPAAVRGFALIGKEMEAADVNILLSSGKEEDLRAVISYLDSLTLMDLQTHFATVTTNLLPRITNPQTTSDISTQFFSLWISLYTINPRETCLATVNTLRPLNAKPYDHHTLVMDPLIVFSCREVFRRGALRIFLRVLTYYMIASKHRWRKLWAGGIKPEAYLPPTTIDTLIQTQDAAIIQCLLEGLVGGEESIRPFIYDFIHQMFIEDPILIRVVAFQTFPVEILKGVVEGVPSMHVCFDFVPGMLEHPNIRVRVFGLQLFGWLGETYPIEKSLHQAKHLILPNIAHLCLDLSKYNKHLKASRDTATTIPFPPRVEGWTETIVGVLVNIAKAFPSLVESVGNLLEELKLPMPMAELRSILRNAYPLQDTDSPLDALAKFQDAVSLTFGKVLRDVVLMDPEMLDKSIR
ncbi:uncharacterized protein SPPG_01835 [Spizellomyces punctatus DAOM BR117]|uniref:Uncharacterized protein n=1 Tax=Spizellomyces punctatus (strain DAOM BR117) TaxID=645134 RepID=A0A0L0HNT1_SPIPD|nr:uncharacterized protein SPPG_01835 [Spizellomyces punctatus DAOM BR117]KND02752.1 hypothetical protein SPPG_01835 [Spizellomyces punctatus DAOM BR117]|eukprot:XP_016610791.1 hypothetical protein SPPG_01835 [Spizellomyces punctatus DAOM BR117]